MWSVARLNVRQICGGLKHFTSLLYFILQELQLLLLNLSAGILPTIFNVIYCDPFFETSITKANQFI